VSGYVVDASVVIKWLIDEPGSEQALKLRDHMVSAPDLLNSECANIIWKKARLGQITPAEASVAARLLVRADIELVRGHRLVGRAVEMAIALDHSAYDCMYLALAEERLRPLVTADQRLVQRLALRPEAAPLASAVDLAAFDA